MNLPNIAIRLSLLSGALAVLASALGAHAMAGAGESLIRSFETAARMHLIHSLVMLVLSLWWQKQPGSRLLGAACGFILFGMLLFSGAIYARVMSGDAFFSKLAPIGGLLLIAGWIMPVFAIFKDRGTGMKVPDERDQS